MQPDSRGLIPVIASVPCVEGNFNEVIISERLILRDIRIPSLMDILQYHDLYKQPEPMNLYIMGSTGSKDLSETLGMITNTSQTYIKYAVFLKNSDGSEGELIGEVSSILSFEKYGRSSVSYVLKQEHGGNGYGREFVGAFKEHLWSLPRKDIIIGINPSYLEMYDGGRIPGRIEASTLTDNYKSQNLLSKLGFTKNHIFECTRWLDYENKINLTYDMYQWVLHDDSFT